MYLKNIEINVEWCLKIVLIFFIFYKDKNIVIFLKKKFIFF